MNFAISFCSLVLLVTFGNIDGYPYPENFLRDRVNVGSGISGSGYKPPCSGYVTCYPSPQSEVSEDNKERTQFGGHDTQSDQEERTKNRNKHEYSSTSYGTGYSTRKNRYRRDSPVGRVMFGKYERVYRFGPIEETGIRYQRPGLQTQRYVKGYADGVRDSMEAPISEAVSIPDGNRPCINGQCYQMTDSL